MKDLLTKSARKHLYDCHVGVGWLILKTANNEMMSVQVFTSRKDGRLLRVGDGQPLFPFSICDDEEGEIKVAAQEEVAELLNPEGTKIQRARNVLYEANQAIVRITKLEIQVQQSQAEIDRLRQLIYLAHPDDCGCEICTAIRAAEPAYDAIICCICNKPITGDDLDDRFWLHAKGCQFVQTGGCTCDYECHSGCYPGHEAEYAPLFDDEDDDE